METSILLATRPELVVRDADGGLTADDGPTKPTRFEAVEEGWVSISRPWHLLTTNTGSGHPHRATAEKGERLLDAIEDRYGRFLVELAESPLDVNFPFSVGDSRWSGGRRTSRPLARIPPDKTTSHKKIRPNRFGRTVFVEMV
jgi:hypothetical protein